MSTTHDDDSFFLIFDVYVNDNMIEKGMEMCVYVNLWIYFCFSIGRKNKSLEEFIHHYTTRTTIRKAFAFDDEERFFG